MTLEEIRELAISEVIERFTNQPVQAGRKCRCPLHQDRTPSFVVYEASNAFHCFGCGAHGDSIAFVKALFNVPFL